MERHPEEYHNDEYEYECGDTGLCLCRSKLDDFFILCRELFCGDVCMFEGTFEAYVNQHGYDQGNAGYGKTPVVCPCKGVDVMLGESPELCRIGEALCLCKRLELCECVRCHSGDTVHIVNVLMGEGRYVRIVGKPLFPHKVIGYLGCHRRSEEGTDVDCHVEDGEGRVPLCRIFRVIVEVSDHYLQVAFEQSCSQGNHDQGGYHKHYGPGAAPRRYGKAGVSGKHHDDAGGYHLAVSEFVSEPASEYRQEID